MIAPTAHELAFAGYLRSLAGDGAGDGAPRTTNRGALAALRRGLGKEPGEAPEMFPYVVSWLPEGVKPWTERNYYLAASLFASHPQTWHGEGRHDLGASMARVRREGSESIEGRFVALLNAHYDALGEHLRSAVALCRSKDVPVDWAALLASLRFWNHEDRRVQRQWARSYWGSPDTPNASPDTSPAAETTT